MNDNMLVCSGQNCKDRKRKPLYICDVCCDTAELSCYNCCSNLCGKCGKKKNMTYKEYKQKLCKAKPSKKCSRCSKEIEGKQFTLNCQHILCIKCVSKTFCSIFEQEQWMNKIINNQKTIICHCELNLSTNVAHLFQIYCFCCGEQLIDDYIYLYNFKLKSSCKGKKVYNYLLRNGFNNNTIQQTKSAYIDINNQKTKLMQYCKNNQKIKIQNKQIIPIKKQNVTIIQIPLRKISLNQQNKYQKLFSKLFSRNEQLQTQKSIFISKMLKTNSKIKSFGFTQCLVPSSMDIQKRHSQRIVLPSIVMPQPTEIQLQIDPINLIHISCYQCGYFFQQYQIEQNKFELLEKIQKQKCQYCLIADIAKLLYQ